MQTVAQPMPSVNGPAILSQAPTTLPEAPCSMTAKVLVKGISCEPILVTGRGLTGAEAAYTLREAVAALQTPPLASRTQRLSVPLACGLEKAVGKGDWKLVERLTKAAALVLAGRVVQMDDGMYQVRSQVEPETTAYMVTGHTCTCQDARKHEAEDAPYYCKHSCAAVLFDKLALQEQEHTAPGQGR